MFIATYILVFNFCFSGCTIIQIIHLAFAAATLIPALCIEDNEDKTRT